MRLAVMVALLGAVGLTLPSLGFHSAADARSSDTGGYPWSDAAKVPLDKWAYDWGYAKCPTSAPNCKRKSVKGKDGITYGLYDPWGYYFKNCTSWVAWKLSQNGYSMPAAGNAKQWDDYFTGKVPVNSRPAVGAIAQTNAGAFGHVAYVDAVSKDGRSVTVSDYNKAGTGRYDIRTEPASNYTYIHVKDLASVDRQPPSAPTRLIVNSVKTSALTLTWKASTDNIGVSRYQLYLNGRHIAGSAKAAYTYSGLKCGTPYTLGVQAVDAAKNQSGVRSIRARTAACSQVSDPHPPLGKCTPSNGCDNRILRLSDGRQFWIHGGRSYWIPSPVISACIQVRAGTGAPLAATSAMLAPYPSAGRNAWCPYPDGTLVQGIGQREVWKVYANGTRHWVTCITTALRVSVLRVPAGEPDGHETVGQINLCS
ncbi:MAG: CHAP domain-containing protein [Gaiellaceae bacterium]